MREIQVILHPIDFSDPSDAAYQMACKTAREHGAALVILHVAPKDVLGYVDKNTELSAEASREKLWEAMRRPRQEETGIKVEHRLEEGDAAKGILRVADETGCGLIVMGTHGRTGLTRWFRGSVAEEVIRKAPCSVLIVKSPEAVSEHSGELAARDAGMPRSTPDEALATAR